MLVLTRNPGEKVVLIRNGEVLGTVNAKAKGNRIIFGFDMKDEIKIIREEICEKK